MNSFSKAHFSPTLKFLYSFFFFGVNQIVIFIISNENTIKYILI